MGRRGPAPQPTALKLARGNPGKRPLSKKEPKPEPPASLRPPSWLDADAQRRWRALAPKLALSGLLTTADLEAFGRYCDTWAWWRRCRRVVQRHGATIDVLDEHGRVKCVQQRPEVSMALRLAQQLSRLEQEFGMTPSSRSRVDGAGGGLVPRGTAEHVPEAQSESARFSDFLGRRPA